MRLFMHRFPYPVAREIPGETELIFFRDLLHSISDVAGGVPDFRFCDTRFKRLIGTANESLIFGAAFPRDDRNRMVGEKTFMLDAEINAYDIALLYDRAILAGGRVHDNVVHG